METPADTRKHWDVFRDRQRAEVAEATIALVAETDAPVTISEIADRAGMSRRTFYKHFPTLGAAMVHTHSVVVDRIRAHAERAQHRDLNGLGRLIAGCRSLFDAGKEHPEFIRFLSYFDFTFRRHGLTPEQLAEFGELYAGELLLPIELLHVGQRDGSIRTDLDARSTAIALGNATIGVLQRLQIMDEYTNGRDEAAQALFDLELEAWRTYLGHPADR
ncbi:TetR/AcrR family transcriptional regulator [Nocardia jiangxiensis]|uniref:TetR/AcrR family transcriptional regulator n=1 Tax=Nocardia jiangxiensis TaxID=282685 RepID=UPI0002F19470|nr:TetR/AcrR family transcriptional regulator [Nocardia jiangxiensis]